MGPPTLTSPEMTPRRSTRSKRRRLSVSIVEPPPSPPFVCTTETSTDTFLPSSERQKRRRRRAATAAASHQSNGDTTTNRNDTMTQDCVEWDESNSLDLRKLADPTFQTPRHDHFFDDEDDDTNNATPDPTSLSRRRLSSSLLDHPSGSVENAVVAELTTTANNDTNNHHASSFTRHSRRLAARAPRRRGATTTTTALSHGRSRTTNVDVAAETATASGPPATVPRSTALDALLHQLEDDSSSAAPLPVKAVPNVPPLLERAATKVMAATTATTYATAVPNTHVPKAVSGATTVPVPHTAKPSKSYAANVVPQPQQPQRILPPKPVPSAMTAVSVVPPPSHAADRTLPTRILPPASQPPPCVQKTCHGPLKAIAEAARITAVANNNNTQSRSAMAPVDDEFGEMDFSLDDLAQLDTLLSQATQQQPSRQHPPPVDSHPKPLHPPMKQQQPQPRESVSVPKQHAPPPIVTTTGDDDPFGDFPDIDVDALVQQQQRELQQQAGDTMSLQSTLHPPKKGISPASVIDVSHMNQPAPLGGDRFGKQAGTTLSKETTNVKAEEDDLFANLPEIDFDAIEKAMAEQQAMRQTNDVVPPANAPVLNARYSEPQSDLSFLVFSRYKVIRIDEDTDTFTKTISVAAWKDDMLEHDQAVANAIHGTHDRRAYDPNRTWIKAGVVHLRGEWFHTRLYAGDIIHICSLAGHFRTDQLPIVLHTCPPQGSDPDDLVLVVHPDMLLTPTVISETVSCTRRAILKTRMGSTGLNSKAALFGTMRHGLFEETMKQQDFTVKNATAHIRRIVLDNAEGLLACRVSTKEAEQEIAKVVPQLQRFANEYTEFGQHKGPRNILECAVLEPQGVAPPTRFIAKSANAIEEPIISPELGLKGNVDMLVNALTASGPSQNERSTSIMGVELKTGHNQRPQNAHMAQLALYIVMMQSRYGSAGGKRKPPNAAALSGVLLYMNNTDVKAVNIAPMLTELKSLIGQRNVVAVEQTRSEKPRGIVLSYEPVKDSATAIEPKVELVEATPTVLPDLLPSSHSCKKCYSNRECMMYSAASRSVLKVAGDTATHGDLLHHYAGHLDSQELEYFVKWDRLIDLETNSESTLIAKSWLIGSDVRELTSSGSVSSLVYDAALSSRDTVLEDSEMSIIGFRRSIDSSINTVLTNVGFASGSYVVVSTDSTIFQSKPRAKGQPCKTVNRPKMHLVRGKVHSVAETSIAISASRDDLTRIERISASGNLCFRLDVDKFTFGTGTLRQNLINLFTADKKPLDEPGSQTERSRLSSLRDVLIRLRKPVFDQEKARSMFSPNGKTIVDEDKIPGCCMMELALEYSELNVDQQNAAKQVISASDYALIQGLPGTGKTSTIAFVARMLAALGKRVLITSYTHAAVDNVLLKLVSSGVAESTGDCPALLRIGQKSACHPGVHKIIAATIARNIEAASSQGDVQVASAESLSKAVESARIVGISALSIPRSALIAHKSFDVVIVDEAGQISQPAIIGALMAADTFVLVGDHMQLPPVVVSELAAKGEYAVSMLKRLADKHPDSVAQLTYQYRMHDDICQISNDIVYKGTLKCANESVAKRQLALPGYPENLPRTVNQAETTWLNWALDTSKAAVFLDTDKIGANSVVGQPSDDAARSLERTNGRNARGSIVNDTEVSIVRTLVGGLLACGLDASSVGVICPFRAQLRLLEECPTLSQWKSAGVEYSTIDRYQGRDKPVIILSFVRSNTKGKVGRLLEDFRRLNVAVTRAKCKLIMIGSYSTLHKGSGIMKSVLDHIRKKNDLLKLPANATQGFSY